MTPTLRLLWTTLILLPTLLGACETTEPQLRLRLEGVVTDSATGAPIAGARAEYSDLEDMKEVLVVTQTDSQGRYSLSRKVAVDECSLGLAIVEVSASGYQIKRYSNLEQTIAGRSPYLSCTPEVQHLDATLQPSGS